MNQRLFALDVFRGMTIFFMIIVNTPGSWSHVYAPLLHAKWNGLTPTDLVFPFFLFIVGVSMAISYQKFSKSGNTSWVLKSMKRMGVIFLIGLLLNWFPFFGKPLSELRFFGVLQRIALAFGGAALIIHFFKEKYLPGIFALILLSYHGILVFLGGSDPLSLEGNLVRALDLKLFGENHLYGGYGMPFDPEGLLSTLPGIATALFGYLLSRSLLSNQIDIGLLTKWMLIATGSIIIGVGWHFLGFPINKPIWSSSYVLVTGGLAILLLCVLIWLIDIIQWNSESFMKKFFSPIGFIFNVFGRNPLISYLLSGLFVKIFFLIEWGGSNLYGNLYTHVFQSLLGDYAGSFAQAIWFTFFVWLFALLLYRAGKVIKV